MSRKTAEIVPLRLAERNRNNATAEEWFARYRVRLRAYISRILPTGSSSDDLVQEVFSKLLTRENLDEIVNPNAYIKMMARNCVVDQLRRSRREQSFTVDEEITESDEQSEWLQYQESMVAIEQALHDLPKRCREVFILARYHGLKSTEISQRLSISQRMVQKHLIKAYDHFRERLF